MRQAEAAIDVTTDQIFNALSNGHRRRILTGLLETTPETDPPVATDTFLDHNVDDDARIEQYHVHLPHLEDAGLIEWDRDAETVKQGQRFAAIKPTLTRLANN